MKVMISVLLLASAQWVMSACQVWLGRWDSNRIHAVRGRFCGCGVMKPRRVEDAVDGGSCGAGSVCGVEVVLDGCGSAVKALFG